MKDDTHVRLKRSTNTKLKLISTIKGITIKQLVDDFATEWIKTHGYKFISDGEYDEKS